MLSTVFYYWLPWLQIYCCLQLICSGLFPSAYSLMCTGLCHKQTWTITVIHYCTNDCQLLITLQQSLIRQPDIRWESWFSLPSPAFVAPVMGSPSEYCHNLWYWKNYNGVATRWWKVLKMSYSQGNHLSGKPGNVGAFDRCQGNVRDCTKKSGNVREKNLVREKLPKSTTYCKLDICVRIGI